MPKTTLYSPIPDTWLVDPATATQKAKGVKFPAGKVIGIVDNGKLKKFGDALEWHLRARGAKDVVRWTKHYSEAVKIITGSTSVHHLDSTASQSKSHRPE